MSTALPPRPPGSGADEHERAGSLAMQLRDIERQAGVRRTL
jgi:hypothetical protein